MSKTQDFFESKEFLEKIIAMMPEHVYWKDLQGVYWGCNDKQATSLGLPSRHDILGKTDYDLSDKATADAFRKIDQAVMKTGKAFITEEHIKKVNEEEGTVLSHKVPLYDDQNNIAGLLGISVDITKLKQTEKALQTQIHETDKAYRSKAEFLSVASHEVRGPVANVITYLDLLEYNLQDYFKNVDFLLNCLQSNHVTIDASFLQEMKKAPDRFTDAILRTSAEASRTLNALRNVGELYRLKTDGIHSECISLHFQDFLDKTLETIYQEISKNVLIDIKISTIPDHIILDSRNLRDVIKIIVKNAIRFSPDSGVVLVQVESLKKENNHYLILSIQDKGCGMSSEQISHVFKTFLDEDDRVFNTRYRKPSFQLPIAEMKMKAMGGEISIESEEGQGTCVTLLCPYEVSSKHDRKPPHLTSLQKKKAISPVMRPLNFLLVEDDPTTLAMEKKQLEELGYVVDVATNGQEAIKSALQKEYDVIWMDITLPDFSGIDTMNKIKRGCERPIDFVAVTSHANEEDEEYFIHQGMTTVLVKPTTGDHFRNCIDRIVAGRLERWED